MAHKILSFVRYTFLGAFILLSIILLNILVWSSNYKSKDVVPTKDKDTYNSAGLKSGDKLDTEPIVNTKTAYIYGDRILTKLAYKDSDLSRGAGYLNNLRKELPTDITFYVMPVPLRICVENGYQEEKEAYLKYLDKLQNYMGEQTKIINAVSIMEEHKDEYIFFRTEDLWTYRGAYYACRLYSEKIGLDMLDLSDYWEEMYSLQNGSLLFLYNQYESVEEIPEDPFYFYLLPNGKNHATLYRMNEGVETSWSQPTITKSGSMQNGHMSSDYEWMVIDGDARCEAKADQYLLIISDNTGVLTAPFLANYYKGVILINLNMYDDLSLSLADFINEYPISDVLYLQHCDDFGKTGYCKAVSKFTTSE